MLEAPEDRIRKSISTETTFKETSDRKKLFGKKASNNAIHLNKINDYKNIIYCLLILI